MGIVRVNNIRLRAFHGCMPKELNVGGEFQVDVAITVDCTKPALTDNLEHTINYVSVFESVKKEMAIPSKLLENVGSRIIDNLKHKFPEMEKVWVKVTKLEPPITNFNGSVSVELEEIIVK